MRPSRKGWVSHYAELIKQRSQKSTFLEDIKSDFSSLNRGKKIYKLVQPTGLMYGHPIKAPGNFDISMSNWNDKEKMKFILFNGFIYNTLLNHSGDIGNETDMDECLRGAINAISNFYKEFIFTPSNSTIRKWKKYNDFELIEIMINKRLEVLSNWINSFWTSFFQNSLLFLDIYYFDLWLSKNEAFTDIEEFRTQQENLRIQILKVMAAAARSDSVIEAEEKALFNFFLKSSKLQIDNQKKAMDLLHSNIGLADIDLDFTYPWLLRKYVLELALLTVWADRNVEDVEMKFLQDLAVKIGFSQQELDDSILAIESFVLSNWENIHFLQKKHSILVVKEHFTRRIKEVVNKNKKAIVQEIHESKELMGLLLKMTKEELTDHEKMTVKAQLIDVLKTLPTFVIIALPGTFITLPLLLSILPSSAFPSAFSEID